MYRYTIILFLILITACKKKELKLEDKEVKPLEVDATKLKDIDGNEYETVVIGNQEWMAENLKVTHYRNGEPIAIGLSDADWAATVTGAYTSYPFAGITGINSSVAMIAKYGLLYNGYAVADFRGLAPEGWRVATDEDWAELEAYIGMSSTDIAAANWRGTQGPLLKSTDNWTDGGKNPGTNSYGFNALPGGYRNLNGSYDRFGTYAYFWTASPSATQPANTIRRLLKNDYATINKSNISKNEGSSIRCIKIKKQVAAPASSVPVITSSYSFTSSFHIVWNEVQDANQYQVRYALSSDMSGAVVKETGATKLDITGLTKETTYYVQVRVANGEWSAVKTMRTATFATVVTTFNLLSSTYDSKFPNNIWSSRKQAVADIITQPGNSPDILGIQEGQVKNQVEDLATLLGGTYSYHISSRNISGRAIFWKTDKYSLVAFDDDIEIFDNSVSGYATQRYITYVRLKEKVTNKELLVFTIHPPSGSDAELQRIRGVVANVVAAKAKALAQAAGNLPVVILGDLNNYPETVISGLPSAPMVFTSNGFTDTFKLALNKTNSNYSTHDGIESGMVTIGQNGSKRIDYIFTYPENKVSVSDYNIVINFVPESATVLKTPIPSDHRPVRSVIHLSY